MKRILFHSEAEWDLHQGILFYERQRPGLGRELRQEVEETVRRIQLNPLAFPLHDDQETPPEAAAAVLEQSPPGVIQVAVLQQGRSRPRESTFPENDNGLSTTAPSLSF